MNDSIDNLLEKITSLSAFSPIFDELRKIDSDKCEEIEKTLKHCVNNIHNQIQTSTKDTSNLKYLLYKESVELKAHSSSYLQYSEMMAMRENALWKFAFDLTEQFFDIVDSALDNYFDAKATIMNKELETDASWYSGIRDTTKKMGAVVNISKKLLKEGLEKAGVKKAIDDGELIDTHSIVEKLIDTHLPPKMVSKDIAKIMKQANKQYQKAWEKEIKTQSPDLSKLKAFTSRYGKKVDVKGFELGAAEQTLAVGIYSAVVATIGLAAG